MDGATVIEAGLANYQRDTNWIVCGWFTEDAIYRPLAEQLAQSLEDVGAAYDLAAIPRRKGGWEANTMAKAGQVLAAMDRHPDKTIVFLDADFTAIGDLSPLASVPGDIGLQMRARRRRNGSSRLVPSSQIIVAKPTAKAREFVSAWAKMCRENPKWGDTDETYFPLVFGKVPNCSIGLIDQSCVKQVLVHHWANKKAGRQSPGWMRELANLSRWAINHVGFSRTRRHGCFR